MRRGELIDDARLQALRAFTVVLVRTRGVGGPDEAERLLTLGFERAALLDIVIAVAQNTIATYVNHLAETPIDAWLKSALTSEPVRPPRRK